MYRKAQREKRNIAPPVFALSMFVAQLPLPNISRCVPVRSPERTEVQAKWNVSVLSRQIRFAP